MSGEIKKIIVNCGACNKDMEPKWSEFTIETGGCPGCDGSYGQMTCLCGGTTKKLEYQCSLCKYTGSIEIY